MSSEGPYGRQGFQSGGGYGYSAPSYGGASYSAPAPEYGGYGAPTNEYQVRGS